jgi:hypothetical protein
MLGNSNFALGAKAKIGTNSTLVTRACYGTHKAALTLCVRMHNFYFCPGLSTTKATLLLLINAIEINAYNLIYKTYNPMILWYLASACTKFTASILLDTV